MKALEDLGVEMFNYRKNGVEESLDEVRGLCVRRPLRLRASHAGIVLHLMLKLVCRAA
jgi:hypothetical protein